MYPKSQDPVKVTSVSFPTSVMALMGEILQPGERSQFVVDAVRDALEAKQEKIKAFEPDYQGKLLDHQETPKRKARKRSMQ